MHLNILLKQPDWEMWDHIMNYRVCIGRGNGVEKDEKKELYHSEEAAICLGVMRVIGAGTRGQRNITLSPPNLDTIVRWKR